jgi:hypothetical protein
MNLADLGVLFLKDGQVIRADVGSGRKVLLLECGAEVVEVARHWQHLPAFGEEALDVRKWRSDGIDPQLAQTSIEFEKHRLSRDIGVVAREFPDVVVVLQEVEHQCDIGIGQLVAVQV